MNIVKKAASRRAVMWAVLFAALALWSAAVMNTAKPPREAGRLAQMDAQARWDERATLLEYESPAYDPTQGDAEAYRASSEAAP
jgi:hypothetical protein